MLYRVVVAACLCTALQTDALNLGSASRIGLSRVGAAPRHTALFMADEPAAEETAAAATVEAPAEPKGRKPKGTSISELAVGTMVEGTVRSVMAYGAFVDIGASTDGLLHVSEISNDFVKDANEKLKAGDKVSVRIKAIDIEKNQLALSSKDESADRPQRQGGGRKKADLSEYESADPKEFIKGTVNSIQEYGAFITLKEGADGLLHISQVQEGGVGKVSDVLKVGDEVEVRVVSFDKAKRRIGLSRLPYVEGEENQKKGRKERGGGRDDAFGNDDAYKMTREELDAITVEDEPVASPFAFALERAELKKTAKAEKKRYAKVVL